MPSFDAVHNTGREAIHSLSHIHALRKHHPRFAQAIQGLSGQSMDVADPRFAQDNPWMVPIHGLRRTYIYIQTYNFETVLRDQMPRAKALGNNDIHNAWVPVCGTLCILYQDHKLDSVCLLLTT